MFPEPLTLTPPPLLGTILGRDDGPNNDQQGGHMRSSVSVTHFDDRTVLYISQEKTLSVDLDSTQALSLAFILSEGSGETELLPLTRYETEHFFHSKGVYSCLTVGLPDLDEVTLEIVDDYDQIEVVLNKEGRLQLAKLLPLSRYEIERLRDLPDTQYAYC